MKLNREKLRRMILNEIRLLNEEFEHGLGNYKVYDLTSASNAKEDTIIVKVKNISSPENGKGIAEAQLGSGWKFANKRKLEDNFADKTTGYFLFKKR